MLSFIYFSLTIFIIISNTTQEDNLSTDSCFNFIPTQSGETNICEKRLWQLSIEGPATTSTCMECAIENIDIIVNDNCTTTFDCAVLRFSNNLMFERFFIMHRSVIKDQFLKDLRNSSQRVLIIDVLNYNVTKITNEYINSTVNIDLVSLTIILKFIERADGVAPLMIENNTLSILFFVLVIDIKCDDDGENSVRYTIYRNDIGIQTTKEDYCAQFSSTNHVSCYNYYYVE
jgi:hypothetical protein